MELTAHYCSYCNNTTLYLYEDGTYYCSNCFSNLK